VQLCCRLASQLKVQWALNTFVQDENASLQAALVAVRSLHDKRFAADAQAVLQRLQRSGGMPAAETRGVPLAVASKRDLGSGGSDHLHAHRDVPLKASSRGLSHREQCAGAERTDWAPVHKTVPPRSRPSRMSAPSTQMPHTVDESECTQTKTVSTLVLQHSAAARLQPLQRGVRQADVGSAAHTNTQTSPGVTSFGLAPRKPSGAKRRSAFEASRPVYRPISKVLTGARVEAE
jgi:hypothetical protein